MDAQNKHLVSDPTQLASTSQGDSGQLSIDSGPYMASAWPAFTNGRVAQARCALAERCKRWNTSSKLARSQGWREGWSTFTQQTRRQLLGSRTLHAAYTRRDTEHKKAPPYVPQCCGWHRVKPNALRSRQMGEAKGCLHWEKRAGGVNSD